jgi:trimeric autotransporter adhesin
VTCGSSSDTTAAVQVTVNPTLAAGTYTINSAAPTTGTNYQSFTAAVNALKCGISGPVTFNVVASSGPYTEQVTVPAINGASATNRITFNGNGTTLQFAPITSARHVLKLDGADYISIKNLKIVSTSVDFGWGVHLMNGADYDSIVNCRIDLSAVTNVTSTNSGGIIGSNSATSVTTAGNNANYLKVINDTIVGGYQGIIVYGNSGSVDAVQNDYIGNVIQDFYSTGIQVNHHDKPIIRNNDIHRRNRVAVTTFTGIELGGSTRAAVVEKNRIHDTHNAASTQSGAAYGIFSTANDAAAGFENIISNNLIYNFNSLTGTIYGLYNSSSDGQYYYHNTVSLDYASATSGTTRGFYQVTTATNIRLMNNNITIGRGGTGAKHALYFGATTTASTITSNYNNLYVSSTAGTNFTGYLAVPTPAASYGTLQEWQGTGNDANSVAFDPGYSATSSTTGDFRPTNPQLDNKGTNVGITTDIMGVTRNTGTPDIGAYEFTIPVCTSPPTAGNATATSTSVCATAAVELSLTGNTSGVGQTYQWQSSSTQNGTYTNIGNPMALPDTIVRPTVTTFYRVAVTCGGQTRTSEPIGVTVNPPHAGGTFTINSAAPASTTNFQTFASAMSAIKCGITGPVMFNVAAGSGPYNEQIALDTIIGVSATNRITINGNGAVLNFNSSNGENRAGIRLNGTDYVTINNLVINSTSTGSVTTEFGFGIQIVGDADFNRINGVTININKASTSTNFAGIAVSNTNSSATTTGGSADSLVITNNTITGGYYGITMVGLSTALIQNNVIRNNVIRDFYLYGIYVNGTNNALIEKNDISRPTRVGASDFYGVYLTSISTNARVSKNRIHDPFRAENSNTNSAYGIYFTSADATAGNENVVSNNVIYSFKGGGIQYGVYNSTSDYARYYHNTILLDDQSYTGTSVTRGFYQLTTATGLDIKNNIIKIARGGAGAKHVLYFGATTTASTFTSDYNNLVISSTGGTTNAISYVATPTPAVTYTTLADWKNAGYDQNSHDLEPSFTDTTAGNLTPTNAALDNKGTNVGITTDIVDRTRAGTPDIGAYEFPAAPVPVTLLNISAVKNRNDVVVNWSTAQEINSRHFIVERSLDAINFTAAGTVDAMNNTNSISSYSFNDMNAVRQATGSLIYYRLKMVDRDGQFRYSPVVSVRLDKDAGNLFSVYPNPILSVAYLNAEVAATEAVTIRVSDAQGKIVSAKTIRLNAGNNVVPLDNVVTLKSGIYFLNFEAGGKRNVVKIVKQ